jgi:hypothetical protein
VRVSGIRVRVLERRSLPTELVRNGSGSFRTASAQVHGVVYHGVSREHLAHSAESAVSRRQQARLDVMQRTALQHAPRWRACDVAVLYCCTDADSPEVQEKLYCECVEAYATGDPMKCQMPYLSVRSVGMLCWHAPSACSIGMLRRHAPSMMQVCWRSSRRAADNTNHTTRRMQCATPAETTTNDTQRTTPKHTKRIGPVFVHRRAISVGGVERIPNKTQRMRSDT